MTSDPAGEPTRSTTDKRSECEVAIVGAGPAGATLALILLRQGHAVTLIEKSAGADRSYRGEVLQPGGQRILDDLGVLAPARARGCHEHSRFQLVQGERALMDIDYRVLGAPYDHLLSIPQQHVLGALVDACSQYPGFSYLIGARATALVEDPHRVTGVVLSTPSGRHTVTARCVVGADGRFSKIRRLAGIEFDRADDFDYDVLWFRLTGAPADPEPAVRVYRAGAAPVLAYRSYPDVLQVGWMLPHGAYRTLLSDGFDAVLTGIQTALPRYAGLIAEQIQTVADVSLLDVFSGRAQRWASDGLLLVGDSAHVHSPIGAQGINLAIQDAVVAAGVLDQALASGDLSASSLGALERARSADVAKVHRIQQLQSKAMLSRNPVAGMVRPVMARLLKHTPVYGKILVSLAYGNRSIRVDAATQAEPAGSKSEAA